MTDWYLGVEDDEEWKMAFRILVWQSEWVQGTHTFIQHLSSPLFLASSLLDADTELRSRMRGR